MLTTPASLQTAALIILEFVFGAAKAALAVRLREGRGADFAGTVGELGAAAEAYYPHDRAARRNK